MTDPRNTSSFNDNMDQEIVLNSDRRFTSIESEPSPAKTEISSLSENSKRGNKKGEDYPGGIISSDNLMGLPSASSYDLKSAGHPIACIFTVIFKASALFSYLFLGVLLPNVITFILVMVLAALDFWTVKNVTGRLLVGLRWWSEYDEKGEEVWKFESFNKLFVGNQVDKAFFWTGQITATAIWTLFFLVKILSINIFWGILTAINFSLCSLNLYGYYRCRGDYKSKIKMIETSTLSKIAGKLLF